jgi:hypothetical protein
MTRTRNFVHKMETLCSGTILLNDKLWGFVTRVKRVVFILLA